MFFAPIPETGILDFRVHSSIIQVFMVYKSSSLEQEIHFSQAEKMTLKMTKIHCSWDAFSYSGVSL